MEQRHLMWFCYGKNGIRCRRPEAGGYKRCQSSHLKMFHLITALPHQLVAFMPGDRTPQNVSINFINFTVEYSCLTVNFLFERNFLHYLIQLYIPSCVLVFASWISFWLNEEAVTARVLLGKCFLLIISDVIIK